MRHPWFVGKDVAQVLGYQNGSRDINRHVDEEDRVMLDEKTQYRFGIEFDCKALGPRGGWIINESGMLLGVNILNARVDVLLEC